MLPLVIASFFGVAAAARSPAAPLGEGCLVSDEGLEARSPPAAAPRTRDVLPDALDVNVHFHIASTEADENLITDKIVDAQWEVLRSSFAAQDIHLVLNSTTRIVDDLTGSNFLIYEGPELGWVHYEEEQNAYFRGSRQGGYDELNIYFFSKYSPGATGYCHFPTVVGHDDGYDYGLDSCQLAAGTMPGVPLAEGGFESWNLGHLAVHEAGHWFGLNHTFAGGCSEPGDFVDDTPAQLTQIWGCPIGSNSCSGRHGVDPIHNFMGYTDDNCTHEFTPGQKDRMFESFLNYRRES